MDDLTLLRDFRAERDDGDPRARAAALAGARGDVRAGLRVPGEPDPIPAPWPPGPGGRRGTGRHRRRHPGAQLRATGPAGGGRGPAPDRRGRRVGRRCAGIAGRAWPVLLHQDEDRRIRGLDPRGRDRRRPDHHSAWGLFRPDSEGCRVLDFPRRGRPRSRGDGHPSVFVERRTEPLGTGGLTASAWVRSQVRTSEHGRRQSPCSRAEPRGIRRRIPQVGRRVGL